jgi:prophage regulatory protein
MQQNEENQKDQLLRLGSVTQQTTMRKHFLQKEVAKGLFPRPIKLGARINVWLQSEVTAVIKARIEGISNDELKTLVIELEATRKSTGGKV